MAKTKTPFFGLDAHGSVGGSITAQGLSKVTLVRTKPLPTYRYTLPQAYQRWLYQDYAYLWTQQSQATQDEYRTAAVRFHLTGFQYWMKYHLTNLPDIMAMWHLDEKAGAIAYDSSRYLTHGVIFGASPTDGIVDGAQYFTLNDYIEITAPQLDFTSQDFSIIIKARVDDLSLHRFLVHRGAFNADGYLMEIRSNGRVYVRTWQNLAEQTTGSNTAAIVPGTVHTIGFSRDGAAIKIYIDGIENVSFSGAHIDPATCARTMKIGIHDNLINYPFEGILDHPIIFNRPLDPTEHLRHALRRYPA